MMQIINDYFIDFSMLRGGIQINLGYAMIIALIWFGTFVAKRTYKSFNFKSKRTMA